MKKMLKKNIALLLSAGICASMMTAPASAADVKFTLNESAEEAREASLIKATYTNEGVLEKAEIEDVTIDANADTYTYTVEDVENGVRYFLWDSVNGMKPLAAEGVVRETTEQPTETDDPTPTDTTAPTDTPTPTATADPTGEYTVKIGTVTGGAADDVMIVKTAAATPAPTEAPTPIPTADPSAVLTFTFGDDTSSTIDSDIDFGKGLKFIGPNSSAYAAGAKDGDFEDGFTSGNRIKLGGKSTFNTARVFEFTPAAAGTIKVYFTHASSSGDPRNCVIQQNGQEIGKQPVDAGSKAIATAEIAAGAPVYIGGDNNIAFYGIVFTPAAAAANLIAPLSVSPADSVEELVTELKVKAGETVTLKAHYAPGESLTLSTDPETVISGAKDIDSVNAAAYFTFTMPAADTTVNAEYTAVVAPTADPNLPEDQAWTTSDAELDAIVLGAGSGVQFGPYNGLSGYGDWTNSGGALTYTHTNGVTYNLPHGWNAGSGGATSRNFYFTPEQACIVTVIYTAQAGRPVYICQGGTGANNRLVEGMDGATDGHPAVLTVDIEDPSKGDIYVVGGSSNKQVYGIFADYYDPTIVVYRTVSGKINYTGSADTANTKIVFTDTNDGTRYEVPFAAEYSVELRQNRSYDISIENNGAVSETLAATLDTNSVSVAKLDKEHNIDVVDIAPTVVTGDVVVHEYTPNDGSTLDLSGVSLTFTAKDDATYTYTVSDIVDNKYTVTMMPNHEYTVTATGIDGYTLSALSGSYMMAAGDTAPFKNILITENLGEVEFTNTVEVGADKTYTKISDAIAAVKAMKDRPAGEAGRVTIEIAPGKYTEQLIISTGYVTLKAADENDRPEINWYYGIGYKYYSANGGYYSEDSAVQKTEKNNVDRWGCAIRIQGQYVLMENIKVINTFNCEIVPEELADGVEPGVYGDVSGKPDRTVDGYDARSQAAVERAAAIAIDSDYFEAYKCDFVSSQDTFYTNTKGSYIKDCYIEGGTDYIYGGKQIAFDNCTLAWHGYSDSAKGGYITACSDGGNTYGYLFKNCTVTNSTYYPNNKFAAGGWGRNWGGAACHVVFDDITIADDVEAPNGWTQMGGPLSEATLYVNNVHRADGTAITGDGFNPNGTMEDNNYTIKDMYEYFDGWTPPHYDGYQPEKTEYTTTWYFGKSNGAGDYAIEGPNSSPVSIVGTGDNPETQTLVVDATSGKFNNSRGDDLAQVNDGTKFTIPVVNGSVIMYEAYNKEGTLTIDGVSFKSGEEYTYYSSDVMALAATETVTATASGVNYMSYIRVVSPANPEEVTPEDPTEKPSEDPTEDPSENPAETISYSVDFLNLKEKNILTTEEIENTTQVSFGLNAAGERVAVDADDVVWTFNNFKYHSEQHGLNPGTIVVKVPGSVKITYGACGWGGKVTVTNSDSEEVVTFNTMIASASNCFDGDTTKNVVTAYYSGPATTLTLSGGSYTPYVAIESVNDDDIPNTVDITYELGDVDGTVGTVPTKVTVDVNTEVTISKYGLLYKDGYTLTAWTPDNGTTEYKVGEKFTADKDMTLTPVFTKNADDARPVGEVVFDFQQQNGAPVIAWQNTNGNVFVAQGKTADGNPIDVKIVVDTNPGKLNNASWQDWAQCNGGTVFTVPVVNGAVVKVGTIMNGTNENAYSINGVNKTGSDQSETIAADITETTIVVNDPGIGYIKTISVTYPETVTEPEDPTEQPSEDPSENPTEPPVYEAGTYAVAENEDIPAGKIITSVSGITMTFGTEGDAAFSSIKSNSALSEYGFSAFTEGNGVNGKIVNGLPTGTFYKFEVEADGKIDAGIVLNSGKAFYVTEGTEAINGVLNGAEEQLLNGVTVSEKINGGIVSFNVEAGKTYYVYCTGSKLGFYGFIFTPAE